MPDHPPRSTHMQSSSLSLEEQEKIVNDAFAKYQDRCKEVIS